MNEKDLRKKSMEKYKISGKYTRAAIRAQEALYAAFFWGDRKLNVPENSVIDRTWDEILYDGYDDE